MIECDDLGDVVAFGGCDDRSVDCPEGEVVVGGYELGDPQRVRGVDRLDDEVAGGQVAQEAHLGLPAEATGEEVGDLRDDECGNDQRPRVRFQQLQSGRVVGIVGVYVGVERAGVDDQRDEAISELIISSTRSEMSLAPLRPAAAPPRRRLRPVPRCASSAVRVICAMVTPWRWASCRSRASRSSGSFTVVRCMDASIPRGHLADRRPFGDSNVCDQAHQLRPARACSFGGAAERRSAAADVDSGQRLAITPPNRPRILPNMARAPERQKGRIPCIHAGFRPFGAIQRDASQA